ncbi:MAG TPA: hypothetical protein DCZ75_15785 [Geobacter sp.]|nr:hypothetical protein [Geobacter sp.]
MTKNAHLLNRGIFHVAVIVAIALCGYYHTLNVPFYWDDNMLLDSPIIKSLDHFVHPATVKGTDWYGGFTSRYVGYLSFALNYRLHGLSLPGFHLVNIAIHIAAALLVYRLVLLAMRTPFFAKGRGEGEIDRRTPFIALLAALLFVAHPIQTQAVTYVVQRFASLATLLYLVCVTSYIEGRLLLAGEQRRGARALPWFVVSFVAATLALWTKQMAYTLPFAIILLEFLLFTRDIRKRLVVIAVSLVPILGLVVSRVSGGGSLAQLTENLDRATRLQTDMPRLDYLATQCSVILTYLRLLFIPVGQRLDYDYPVYSSFAQPKVFICCAILSALLVTAAISLYHSRDREDDRGVLLRLVGLGIFWFFITLSIESSVIPIVDVIFEHRLYLPSVGFFIAVAAGVSMAGGANPRIPGWPRWPVAAASLAALLLLLGATHARNTLWGDQVAFWQDNAKKSPGKLRVLVSLGRALENKGEYLRAAQVYRTLLEIDPTQTDPLLNLGLLEIRDGKLDQAQSHFEQALAIDPLLVEGHNNLGQVLGMQRRYDEALKEFLLVLKLKPSLAPTHNNVAVIHAEQKRYDQAFEEYGKCLALDPNYANGYLNRGKAYLAVGKKSEAAADFRRVLELEPGNAEGARQLRLAQGL